MSELIDRTVVVLARQLNPSILSETWLANFGVLTPEELAGAGDRIYTSQLVRISLAGAELLAVPDRLQLIASSAHPDAVAFLRRGIRETVSRLPQTPYTALGLNSRWFAPMPVDRIPRVSRRLFAREDSPLWPHISSDETVCGHLSITNMLGGKRKMAVEPAEVNGRYGLLFAFNYHFDLAPANPAEQAVDLLGARLDESIEDTRAVLASVEESLTNA